HPVPHQNEIGIVGDKATGCTEMDDVAGIGASFTVSVDVSHYIVTPAALVRFCTHEIDILDMGAELLNLYRRDARGDSVIGPQTQLVLGLRQGYPETPPSGKLPSRSPKLGHLVTGITGHERVVVKLKGIHDRFSSMRRCSLIFSARRAWRAKLLFVDV